MCEPHHSIVQFPTQDQDDNDLSGPLNGGPGSPGIAAKLGSILKKIGGWFHLSRMGFGHSESFAASGLADRKLPAPLQHEVDWATRSFSTDPLRENQRIWCPEPVLRDAVECAHIYADRVSIGSLPVLRQFLERSMEKTDRPGYYLDQFTRMVLPQYRDKFVSAVRKIVGRSGSPFVLLTDQDLSLWARVAQSVAQRESLSSKRKELTRLMVGWTRKRSVLIPEWADDAKLWTPSS